MNRKMQLFFTVIVIFTSIIATVVHAEPKPRMVLVSTSIASEIAKNQQEIEGATAAMFKVESDNYYFVPEETYNTYYYNALPWWGKAKAHISRLFSPGYSIDHSYNIYTFPPKSISQPGSGALKSFALVPISTSQTRQRSRITIPKVLVPTQKTLERAKKLDQPYIPAPSSKDSASKALKRAERFGGYQ